MCGRERTGEAEYGLRVVEWDRWRGYGCFWYGVMNVPVPVCDLNGGELGEQRDAISARAVVQRPLLA